MIVYAARLKWETGPTPEAERTVRGALSWVVAAVALSVIAVFILSAIGARQDDPNGWVLTMMPLYLIPAWSAPLMNRIYQIKRPNAAAGGASGIRSASLRPRELADVPVSADIVGFGGVAAAVLLVLSAAVFGTFGRAAAICSGVVAMGAFFVVAFRWAGRRIPLEPLPSRPDDASTLIEDCLDARSSRAHLMIGVGALLGATTAGAGGVLTLLTSLGTIEPTNVGIYGGMTGAVLGTLGGLAGCVGGIRGAWLESRIRKDPPTADVARPA